MVVKSSREFCYWLQGAIEIGGLREISEQQRDSILQLLASFDEHSDFTKKIFCLLTLLPHQVVFPEICQALQQIFIHDIDPTYDGDQAYFHDLHQGNKMVENL